MTTQLISQSACLQSRYLSAAGCGVETERSRASANGFLSVNLDALDDAERFEAEIDTVNEKKERSLEHKRMGPVDPHVVMRWGEMEEKQEEEHIWSKKSKFTRLFV